MPGTCTFDDDEDDDDDNDDEDDDDDNDDDDDEDDDDDGANDDETRTVRWPVCTAADISFSPPFIFSKSSSYHRSNITISFHPNIVRP